MKRLEIVKEMRIIHVAMSLLMVFGGVFLLAWQEIAPIIGRYLVGSTFLLIGAARTLGYFSNDLYRLAFQYDLALGTLALVLGVLFVISPDNVQTALPFIIGVYVLIDALLKLQTAVDAKAFGMRHWWGLMLSALLIAASAVAIIVLQTVYATTYILVPVALMLDGAESIWNTLGTVRIRTKKEGRYEELLQGEESR